jgi:hypothetical protein
MPSSMVKLPQANLPEEAEYTAPTPAPVLNLHRLFGIESLRLLTLEVIEGVRRAVTVVPTKMYAS